MSKFLQALEGKNEGRPPVWLMRQAGRYMPAYQKIRKGRSLAEMFHDAEVMVEVTKLPLALGVDAAILFADILNVCDGLGVAWHFEEGKGPVLRGIPKRQPFAYPYTREAVSRLKEELPIPLIGFAGGPFTVATYILEGGSSRDQAQTKQLLYSEPDKAHALLEAITEETLAYLQVQIDAGVDAIQVFDSWAGTLDREAFATFALPYLKRVVEAVPRPTLLFCRGSSLYAEALASTGATGVSIDWQGDLKALRAALPHTVLQGNLDPTVLLGTPKTIRQKAAAILDTMKDDPAFIFNLGHGVLPQTPYAHVELLIEAIR